MEYQQIAALYNSICVSFPKLTKLSDKRKKSIRARFKQGYTLDDFKKVFELAEGSRFLKGGNSRNWHATFDWMIADANMAKVLTNGTNPQVDIPAATFVIFASAIPQSIWRSGNAFLNTPVFVAAARSASKTTRFSCSFPSSTKAFP